MTQHHNAPSSPESGGRAPSRRRGRRWLWPAAAVLCLVVGISIGGGDAGVSASRYDAVVAERDDLEDQLAVATAAVQDAQGATADEQGALGERSAELDAREAALHAREDAVVQIEQTVAASQIGIGTWTVGVDLEPGTYRTAEPVTSTCYWGIYRSGTNGEDILQNDIVNGGHPTVTLAEGQDFENGCGTFVKQ
ncbi:hypothetical protein SAMN05421867_11549 [Cellulomonas marina]|uniref:Uncharacterized protein n=2 Tax=Cellulomonas marina TaxID=988821 RepID=A0A1I1AA14_9CELL|nr:hypothetical protein SAMN05421867_11549 [Cellulomonas marina]